MDQAALHRAQWEERETEGYIQHNTKFCPRCKAPVEKNGSSSSPPPRVTN